MNTMVVEDFTVLGRTVPEESKSYGQRICMAGFSKSNNQFLRVYPLLLPVGDQSDSNGFRARHTYSLRLRRNERDSRSESWRVVDEAHPSETPWERASEVKKSKLLNWLTSRAVPSIQSLNECQLSLGVVIVKRGQWSGTCVARNDPAIDEAHQNLFEEWDHLVSSEHGRSIRRIEFAPYIHFSDRDGLHRLQVREWGANILLSKEDYASNPDALWNAPGYRQNKDMVFVLGNMNNHRKNWLIIKTFELDDPDDSPGLFDSAVFKDEAQ